MKTYVIIAFISLMTGVSLLVYDFLIACYIRKNNKKITFVVRLKNGITHYIDLPEKTTREKLIKCVIRISDEEKTNIIGIYNIYGEELEYVEGVWIVK